MSFVAALLPVVIYIVVVYVLDNFALISVKRLLLLVLCGMGAALVCFGLFQLTGLFLSESVSDYVNPVLEEAVKAIPLLILARRKKIAFFIDSVICGAAVGGYRYHVEARSGSRTRPETKPLAGADQCSRCSSASRPVTLSTARARG